MKETTIRGLRKYGKVFLIAAALFLLIVTIVINVIITPSKLTPLALKYAREYLDADVDIESVEVTFFSSFPSFGVKVSNGRVVSHAFHRLPTDTIYARRDTLALWGELRAEINLFHTLFSGDIVIGHAELSDAVVRLYTDSLGRNNYDILISDSTEVDSANDDDSSMSFSVKHIEIKNSKVRYADKISQIYAGFKGLDLEIDGDINLDNMDMDVSLSDTSTSFRMGDTRYLRRLPVSLNGHIAYDDVLNQYQFEETCIVLDGHDIDMDGYIEPDSTGVDISITYGIGSPSVEKLFALIPKSIVGDEVIVESGSIEASGYVKGRLDDEHSPVIGCNVSIDDVKGHYEGMPRGVDDMSAKFDALIDFQKPLSSYLNLELFHFEGGNSEVESVVKVTELLDNANVYAKLKAHIDLLSLRSVFPMPDTHMYGLVNANLITSFSIDDLKKRNYGKIKLSGNLDVDSMSIVNDSLRFSLNNDAHLLFSGRDSLKVDANISYLNLTQPDLIIRVRDFIANGRTIVVKGKDVDTTAIVPLAGGLKAEHAGVKVDTLMFYAKHVSSSASINPMKDNIHHPHLEASIKTDTLYSKIYGVRGVTRLLNTHAMLEQTGDSTWNSDMLTEFDKVQVTMPRYRLPMVATDTRITQKGTTINIEKSHVSVGHSSMDVKAEIHNLYRSLVHHQALEATLTVDADTINCNELLSAVIPEDALHSDTISANMADTSLVVTDIGVADSLSIVPVDSLPQRVIVIPQRIHFSFASKINTLLYDKLQVDDIKGNMEMVNGCLHVKNISFKQGKSRGISLFAYKGNADKQRADLSCFVRWERADIAELVTDLHLDTIMPMLSSFKGQIDCYMTLKTQLDSTMMPDISSAQASIHMGGKRLTLLDGETFSKLSKMLMFKNKKENLIDTMSFNVLVDSGKITVLPFVTNIDRYSAVVGGSQDFDMNLNYHVSIIKSPLPFKAGVTVKGKPDHLDFGITTAKLKKKAKAAEQAKNDSLSLMRRIGVIRDMYHMSGLSMPQQLQTEQERQEAALRAKMQAAIAEAEEDETEDADDYLDDIDVDMSLCSDSSIVSPSDSLIDAHH